ncbi:MAG: hypothetical protein KAT06_07550 [Gammaproteobacteria bacterium]|nr:hypothetical protein [Gammaproteobacteria bacterium]
MKYFLLFIGAFFIQIITIQAQDRLELETTFIKGNKELPQILYLVPWKDIKRSRKKEQQIVLYSLFGDLFEPVNPDEFNHAVTDIDGQN